MTDTQSFKLKGRIYTLTVVQLLNVDDTLFDKKLSEVVEKAPRLFDNTPVIIDFSAITAETCDVSKICRSLRAHGMVPLAMQGGSATIAELAEKEGLTGIHASSTHDRALIEEPGANAAASSNETIRTRLFTSPVRSGQQVASKDGDLVVTASVSHGAELLADGNIHVYGALRGRALAGISGDKQARIFCQSLDAELVAIAGIYCLSDVMKPVATPCQIYLQDDRIQIEPL